MKIYLISLINKKDSSVKSVWQERCKNIKEAREKAKKKRGELNNLRIHIDSLNNRGRK